MWLKNFVIYSYNKVFQTFITLHCTCVTIFHTLDTREFEVCEVYANDDTIISFVLFAFVPAGTEACPYLVVISLKGLDISYLYTLTYMAFRYLVRFTNVELLNWSKVGQQEMKFSECFD